MKHLIAIAALTALSGCAYPQVQVDLKNPTNPPNFQQDMLECQGLADRGVSVTAEQMKGGLTQGVGSMASSAVMGVGPYSGSMAVGSVIGGVIGGGFVAEANKRRLVARCLWLRGYSLTGMWAAAAEPAAICRNEWGDDYDRCIEIEEERWEEWRRIYNKPEPSDGS